MGDDSRDGLGELVADVVCELKTFFGPGNEDVDGLELAAEGRPEDC
jgi:hypothetical protein